MGRTSPRSIIVRVRTALAALTAAVVAMVVAGAGLSGPSGADQDPGIRTIRHVVIVMQENRSFDSYFGTFPGADGIGPAVSRSCVADVRPRPCVKPFHDRFDLNVGGPHGAKAYVGDVAGGAMNGFVRQERAYLATCTTTHFKVCSIPNNPPDVMGYHNGADIPNYWAYARQFVLQDHMFSSAYSWSLPDHLYLVSEWSARCSRRGVVGSCRSDPTNPPASWTAGVANPNAPRAPDYAWTDLTYLLHRAGINWRYYVTKGSPPDCPNGDRICAQNHERITTPGFWNPLPFFDTVRQDHQLANIQRTSKFFRAAAAGTLPAVSWVIPSEAVSEHPTELVSAGESYVTHLVNAVMRGPSWPHTAIFIAWDDWGGFYDHIVPPTVDGAGYGIRVPSLVISPYAKQGYVDHQTLSFDAYVKFIEDDFLNGQRLDPRTDGRPDRRPDVRENAEILGDLRNDFDFAQAPRAPLLLPIHPASDLLERKQGPEAPPFVWSPRFRGQTGSAP